MSVHTREVLEEGIEDGQFSPEVLEDEAEKMEEIKHDDPFGFENALKIVGEAAKEAYGVNPYENETSN